MTKEFATAFAQRWVESWNSHDLDKILSFYSEDFIIETPMALLLYPQSGGTVIGKSEVRNYWTIGLEKNPLLHFELLDVLLGVNSLGMHLFNAASNKKSVELVCFNEDMEVYRSIVTYAE